MCVQHTKACPWIWELRRESGLSMDLAMPAGSDSAFEAVMLWFLKSFDRRTCRVRVNTAKNHWLDTKYGKWCTTWRWPEFHSALFRSFCGNRAWCKASWSPTAIGALQWRWRASECKACIVRIIVWPLGIHHPSNCATDSSLISRL